MNWIKRGIFGVLLLLLLAAIGIYATGNGPLLKIIWDMSTGSPDLPFDANQQPGPTPDYSNEGNWAALPWREDLADLVPAGVKNRYAQGKSPVDVFFVHPTGFLKGSSWTFSMDPQTSTEENTQWMMANQASAYNGCCNVYAPRYRQASICAFRGADIDTGTQVLEFSYKDVEQAFEYYLEHFNEGRPFVLASHSQGTRHALALLKNKINGTPQVEQMVAAYLIGGHITRDDIDSLGDITACDSPEQLHCVIHWDTFSEATQAKHEAINTLCVNPLSWQVNGPLQSSDQHQGAVPVSGEFHFEFSGDDAARGVTFEPLATPRTKLTTAHCAGGRLYITDQTGNDWKGLEALGDTYHLLDYPMFHMDIRNNAILRTQAYIKQ